MDAAIYAATQVNLEDVGVSEKSVTQVRMLCESICTKCLQ